ncbi:MAG: type II secretion system protein [Planctomycetes bacterium]|nr:type II secretion system protein [Planctomycetota bacterium]
MNRHTPRGYTLVEMLVALAVGMAVMQIAFASFFFIQKFVRKIERVDGFNQVAQAAVLWSIGKPDKVAQFPLGEQISRVGVPVSGNVIPPDVPIQIAVDWALYRLRDHEAYKAGRDDTMLLVPIMVNP